MLKRSLLFLLALSVFLPQSTFCSNATPDQVLVLYEKTWLDTDSNGKSDSLDVAEYYMTQRGIPAGNILEINTAIAGTYSIDLSLTDYETMIAAPVRNWLDTNLKKDKIFYIVMCLGMRYKINGSSGGPSIDALLTDPYTPIDGVNRSGMFGISPVREVTFERTSNSHIWSGRAALTPYYLVCRLDGPSLAIAKGLVDKAIQAEKNNLGKYHPYLAYVDYGSPHVVQFQDDCLKPNPAIFQSAGWMCVKEETSALFSSLPNFLWYSGSYAHTFTGTFDFRPGAVAIHMESMVAFDFRNRNSLPLTQQTWCAGFLNSGVTATVGTIDEPYLSGVLEQNIFFDRFVSPKYKFNFANAAYAANAYDPSSSADWMMIMIGDPLYCIYNSPEEAAQVNTPNPFDLVKVYPQPFKPSASLTGGVRWANLPVDATLEIFDGSGKLLRTVKEVDQGNSTIIVWDGKDEAGNLLPTGIYYYGLGNGAARKTGKIAYVR